MALVVSTLNDAREWEQIPYPDSHRAVVVDEALVIFDGDVEVAGFSPGMWGTFARLED